MASKVWQFIFDKTADKQFARLDKTIQKRIIQATQKIIQSPNPKALAKQLTGSKAQFWRYRVGTHRIIVRFEDLNLIILAVKIAHRKDVYK